MNKDKEHKFEWNLNFMSLTLTISWLAGTAMLLAIVAMIVKWAIQYIFQIGLSKNDDARRKRETCQEAKDDGKYRYYERTFKRL